ncbi:MAG: hypothetical protein Q8N53_18810, partial [Longimicrobiales bacterium]|nr:hypothetical protein [Longimicrobiales bacterium]
HIAVSMLLIAGLVGLYGQERGRAGKVAKAGFILLFTSLLAWSALLVLGMVFGVSGKALLMEVLGVTFVFLLPPGFLLLGIGLEGPVRRVPLALGSLFVAWILVPRAALIRLFPSAADFLRPGGESPLGVTVFFLMGVGAALMGYAVFRNAAPAPSSRP